MNVKGIMNPDTTLATPTTTLKEAADKMARNHVGFLPVGENDRLEGTVTDRDIVVRGISKGKDAQTTAINEVFTGEVFYCREDDGVEEAVRKMGQHQVRRLPVINSDKQFVGVVSIGDIAQHLDKDTAGRVLAEVTDWR